MKRTSLIILVFLTMLISASCSLSSNETPPYAISVPVCVLGSRPPYYELAGIEFGFINTADKTIVSISFSCRLYDAETEDNPFIGSNQVNVTMPEQVAAGAKAAIIINLDPYIYIAPLEPYIIDFFYVTQITYADGSVWEDKYGTYTVSSYE